MSYDDNFSDISDGEFVEAGQLLELTCLSLTSTANNSSTNCDVNDFPDSVLSQQDVDSVSHLLNAST